MKDYSRFNRRHFLKTAAYAGGAAWATGRLPLTTTLLADVIQTTSQVSLTAGTDHVDIIFQGLQRFKKQIAAAIGNRPVLIKPNNVIGTPDNGHGDVLLSDTPVESLEAILEFLKSIGKTDVFIGETCGTDPTFVAFDHCGYFSLSRKYPVRFLDLSTEGYEVTWAWGGAYQQNIRLSKLLLSPDFYVISAAKIKTHNYVVATLSLKNVVMGAPIVDPGKYRNIANCATDKNIMHNNNWNAAQDLNDNIHLLASRLAPDLAVIDGFQGMEGNGPCWGTPVNQHVAVVAQDWLAADRVGVELMAIDPSYMAYLNYCWQTGLGQYDLTKIDVLGESIANHQYSYRLNDSVGPYLGPYLRPGPRTS
jgi:uncharacterized protein (DUF362 family)